MDAQFISTLAIALAAVSSIASALGVWVSRSQVQISRRTSQIELYVNFRERNARADMNDALVGLFAWRESNGPDFANTWIERFRQGEPDARVVNQYRRLIAVYVGDVASAYDLGALTPKLARRVLGPNIYNVYLEICMPMHEALYGPITEARANLNALLAKIRKIPDRLRV